MSSVTFSSSHSSMRARPNRSNASLIMRRLEEVSLQPVPPSPMEEIDPPGLPSYEQAIAKSGPHDAPPPPYPGYLMHLYLQLCHNFSSFSYTQSIMQSQKGQHLLLFWFQLSTWKYSAVVSSGQHMSVSIKQTIYN